MVNHLRSGKQAAISVILNNIKYKRDLAEFFGAQLEAPADSFLSLFNSERALAEYDLSPRTVLGIFRPNTYQLYWNTSAQATLERMIKENIEWLSTIDDDEIECIGIENLESILTRFFNRTITLRHSK